MWVGLNQSVQGPKKKDWVFLTAKGIQVQDCNIETLLEFPACVAFSMDFGLASPHNRDYPLGLVSLETLMNTAMQADCESHSDCNGGFEVSVDFPVDNPEAT